MASSFQKPAPDFQSIALIDGKFKNVSLDSYAGKFLVLLFYPMDFTFVCPTELMGFSERLQDFLLVNCEVLACSTDSQYAHLAWTTIGPENNGVGKLDIPLMADKSMDIARSYGVLNVKSGTSFRSLFIIDNNKKIRYLSINDESIGRSVDEVLRIIQAIQHVDNYGEACPINWSHGDDGISMDPNKARQFYEDRYKKKTDVSIEPPKPAEAVK